MDQIDDKIVIVGAGNVGLNLLIALYTKGFKLIQFYTRDQNKAKSIHQKYQVPYCTSIEDISPDGDIYFFTLPDDYIRPIAEQVAKIIRHRALFIHSSGSSKDDLLDIDDQDFGVLYPLQTFSENKPIDFSDIPLFYTGSSPLIKERIKKIGNFLSAYVNFADEKLRNTLHIAAVFSCNFTTYLLKLAEDLCLEQGLDFQYLKPLVEETVHKSFELGPVAAQTGPAIRGDEKTIKLHLSRLKGKKKKKKIYKLLSAFIKTASDK